MSVKALEQGGPGQPKSPIGLCQPERAHWVSYFSKCLFWDDWPKANGKRLLVNGTANDPADGQGLAKGPVADGPANGQWPMAIGQLLLATGHGH